jgi:hypothetical protein
MGSLSSEASYSETLVPSQIDLGRDLIDESLEEEETSPLPPPLPPRDNIPRARSSAAEEAAGTSSSVLQQSQQSPSKVAQRSVHCEAGEGGPGSPGLSSGYPVTLTSSTSGTTVCTQVETTFESKVLGEPEREDDQEGNIFMQTSSASITLSNAGPKKTHRRSESQSWSDSLLYGIEEKLDDEQIAKEIFVEDDEITSDDLFEGTEIYKEERDPIERPITPEPGFSPEERKTGYYPGSSFEQQSSFQQEIDDGCGGGRDFTTHESIFERMIQPISRLEDIEEENGSLKNSPKSVQSLEIQMGAGGPEWGSNGSTNGDKGRPGSRESTSSLKGWHFLLRLVNDLVVNL